MGRHKSYRELLVRSAYLRREKHVLPVLPTRGPFRRFMRAARVSPQVSLIISGEPRSGISTPIVWGTRGLHPGIRAPDSMVSLISADPALIGDAFWGGSWGGWGPQKEYELRGGFYPGNWLLMPNQLSHHKLKFLCHDCLTHSLAAKTQGCPSRIYQFSPSLHGQCFSLFDSRTSLPQKVPAANHIHRNHQRVSHVLNRNVPFVSVAFLIK